MPKDATINARVDSRLNAKAEKVLGKIGLSTSDAITMFLHQVVYHKGLPFEARIPNAETIAAMRELDAGLGERFTGPTKDALDQMLRSDK